MHVNIPRAFALILPFMYGTTKNNDDSLTLEHNLIGALFRASFLQNDDVKVYSCEFATVNNQSATILCTRRTLTTLCRQAPKVSFSLCCRASAVPPWLLGCTIPIEAELFVSVLLVIQIFQATLTFAETFFTMGKGGSAQHLRFDFGTVTDVPTASASQRKVWSSTSVSQLTVAVFLSSWLVSSIASLFIAKHVLHQHRLNETVFTLWQFALSVTFGLLFTKIFRLHSLASLSTSQLRAIVPLSMTFLVKELLKYAALTRISVNLVNTIRSLSPMFNVLLEYIFLGHIPQRPIVFALFPIVVGVALTSVDEIHLASTSNSMFIALVGFLAAVLSTAINIGQNIYSKILFGRDRIDPVSLQIYLSALSFLFMSPFTLLQLAHQSIHLPTASHFLAPPSSSVVASVVLAGFVNFMSSQLAFNTLRLVSPLSYSVANTFKRVAIAIVAIIYFSERLSVINGIGISVSIAGIFFYERVARTFRQARQYPGNSTTPIDRPQSRPLSKLPTRKQNASGPDLVALDVQSSENSVVTPTVLHHIKVKPSELSMGSDPVQRHLCIDVADNIPANTPRASLQPKTIIV